MVHLPLQPVQIETCNSSPGAYAVSCVNGQLSSFPAWYLRIDGYPFHDKGYILSNGVMKAILSDGIMKVLKRAGGNHIIRFCPIRPGGGKDR